MQTLLQWSCCGSITHSLVCSMFIGFHIVDSTIPQITINIIVNSRSTAILLFSILGTIIRRKKRIFPLVGHIVIMLASPLKWNVSIHRFHIKYGIIIIVFWIKYANICYMYVTCNTYICSEICPESMSRCFIATRNK